MTAYCPKEKKEVSASKCFSCKHYYGIKIVPRKKHTWIAIECTYGGENGEESIGGS